MVNKDLVVFNRNHSEEYCLTGNPNGTNRPWNNPATTNHFDYNISSNKPEPIEKDSEEKQYYKMLMKEKSNSFSSSSTPSEVKVQDLI